MNVKSPWFENWFGSPYYHQLYFKRDQQEAAGFIDKLVHYLKPSAGSLMLDVGCGRGRHSVQLAEKGFDVTGIDFSDENIVEANRFKTDHLHFFKHDMRLPFWINFFDYAFNFFTSLGYFKTRRENENAIRTICESLKNEGIFVIDYLNTHYGEQQGEKKYQADIDGVIYHISKWNDDARFYKSIRVEDPRSKTPLEVTEEVAKFSPGDFTDMLSLNKMQVQQIFGDYDLSEYKIKESPRMIIVAKKMMH